MIKDGLTLVSDAITSTPLFSPIKITNRITLPNRFVMQPMYLNFENEFKLQSEPMMRAMGAFYAERAYYGAKLIVCGGLSPSRLGKWKDDSLTLSTIDDASSFAEVTSAVHRAGGFILAQAFNAGRSARKRRLFSSTRVPSPVQPFKDVKPIQIPGIAINYVVSEYERFARLAEDAGFDGIEIPLGDGSLLHNFLSPAVNTRRDRFGGNFANRVEIVLRVLETVKLSLQRPNDFCVCVRLCVHDLKEDGSSFSEILSLAEILARSQKVDLLNTSVGMHDSPIQTLASFVPQGTFSRSVKLVREHLRGLKLDIPIISSHRVHSVAVAEKLIETNVCDLVGIARPLLADAQFIEKAKQRKIDEIVPCIACNHCVDRLYKHQRITCAINPITGYELERRESPPQFKKRVAVVGAGPAGVTCALTLWRRGHDVTLFEKGKFIGGQVNLAKLIPGKESYQEILEYWTRQLRKSSINVRLNSEFSREDLSRNHQFFHAVVLCTGSIPRPITSSFIPGASECRLIVPFSRILDGSVKAGRRVGIIGNGAISHDVASFLLHDPRVSRSVDYYLDEWGVNLDEGTIDPLAFEHAPRNNRDVVIINKADKDADLSRGRGWTQKLWIRNHGGTIIKHALTELVDHRGIHMSFVLPDARKFVYECDTIVWCYGMLPNISVGTWIYEWMKDGAIERGEMISDFGIYMAGSCRDSWSTDGHGEQDLLQAVHEGYEIGYKI